MIRLPIDKYKIGEVVVVWNQDTLRHCLAVVVEKTKDALRVDIPIVDTDEVKTETIAKKNAITDIARVTDEDRKLASWLEVVHRGLCAEEDKRDPDRRSRGDDVVGCLGNARRNLADAHVLLTGWPIYAASLAQYANAWKAITRYFEARPQLKRIQIERNQ